MRAIRAISHLMFGFSAYICIPVILVVISADVFKRYVLNDPWTWSQELCSILLFVSVTLAGPEAWLKGVHIRAEFLQLLASEGVKRAIERIVWALVLLISIAFAYQSWVDGRLMILISERLPELDISLVYFRAILGIASVSTALIALWGLITGFIPQPVHEAIETSESR